MAFHNHRATCSKGGCGVTASSRESERKVGSAENGDRADRALYQADFRSCSGLAVGLGFIDATIQIVTLADMAGKRRSWPVVRPRSPCRRATGKPVSCVPTSVMASARASISSAMASRKVRVLHDSCNHKSKMHLPLPRRPAPPARVCQLQIHVTDRSQVPMQMSPPLPPIHRRSDGVRGVQSSFRFLSAVITALRSVFYIR